MDEKQLVTIAIGILMEWYNCYFDPDKRSEYEKGVYEGLKTAQFLADEVERWQNNEWVDFY